MKILLVSRFLPYIGGRETSVLLLAEELSKFNDVAILTPDIGRASDKYKIFPYGNIQDIKAVLKGFKPDIINSHTFYLTPKVIKANSDNVSIVLTLHGDLLGYGNDVDKKLFIDMIPFLKKVITVCNHGYNRLDKDGRIDKNKLGMIKCSIDTDIFKPRLFNKKELRKGLRLPEDKFIAIIPTRMTLYKGLNFLLQSLQEIKDNEENLFFLVATPPSRYREEETLFAKNLIETAKSIGLCNMFSIGFYDFVSMPFLYNASDLLIIPSMTEQLPISIMEAQSSGLPVIATNVGGISEAVVNGQTGYLVDYGDTKKLAQCILDLYSDKSGYLVMSRTNRNVAVASYYKNKMISSYYNLFQSLI